MVGLTSCRASHSPFASQIFANNVACNNETVPIYGLEVTASPAVRTSVMVGFDFGVPCGPITNTPPAVDTGRPRPPERPRRSPADKGKPRATDGWAYPQTRT